jgi:hypothetical protein
VEEADPAGDPAGDLAEVLRVGGVDVLQRVDPAGRRAFLLISSR